MPSDKKGMDLQEYREKLENEKYAMRIGKEVPEGDVNLAYLHTPALDSDQNISLLDMASTSDNIIPDDQLESIVIPDQEGRLHYTNIISETDPIKETPPYEVFPSKNIRLTREFKKNEHTTENALYYLFEIKYHYDSMKVEPNKVTKYTGQQIELTDENGNPLDDRWKYDIYVMAMEENPQIYWVKIYLHMNTDMVQTFKVRYNHIDEVVDNEKIVNSNQKELSFYQNSQNQIEVNGETKQLLEGGKLRIINGVSAYKEVSEEEFSQYDESDEVYKVVERPLKDGYEIFVPQRSEMDPRPHRMFNYRVIAKYNDRNGREQKVTVGYINDWVMNPESLLNHEKREYTEEWKQLGIPNGERKLNVKEMIETALPIGTPSIPDNATYEIYDAEGNLLYTTVDAPDNEGVETNISAIRNNSAEARAIDMEPTSWKNALQKNVRLKTLPIPHKASIIAERQKTKWDYEFVAKGQGVIRTGSLYEGNWWVCANAGVYKGFTTDPLDVVNKNKWYAIGSNVTTKDWMVKTNSSGISYVELQLNEVEVAGFYQKVNPKGELMNNKTDYEFSAKVKIVDPGDDDVIGLLFRVQDSQHYYMFAWEREKLMNDYYIYSDSDFPENHGLDATTMQNMKTKGNGPGRIVFGDGGCAAYSYDPDYKYHNPKLPIEDFIITNWNTYKSLGFGSQKKRIFKASPRPSNVPAYTGYSASSKDRTGCSYKDITTKGDLYNSTVGRVGWELGKEYKITVLVAGNHFSIYINEDPTSEDRGTLVCEATDDTYKTGSAGIFCTSQRWAQWTNLTYNELEVGEVCSEKHPMTLSSNDPVKVSEQTVTDLLKTTLENYAKEKYGTTKYIVFSYNPYCDKDDIHLNIDQAGLGYIWAQTDNPLAGGIREIPWDTTSHNLDVYGTGSVQFHEDGHFTITISPEKLSMDDIPPNVEDFQWTPIITKGENISLSVDSDGVTLIAQATVPPIEQLHQWVVLPEDFILKEEGIKKLANVFGSDGILEQLHLPSDIPLDEVLLRIERGEATGPFTAINQEHRVNYRFRELVNGLVRLPVDQFQNQLGVNRLRLSGIYNTYKQVNFDIEYLVYVPVNIETNMQDVFARDQEGAVMIEQTENENTWVIEDGFLKDKDNQDVFKGAYSTKYSDLTHHVTDFSFKPIGNDDDLIGVLFRVKDKNNFYLYAIEGDQTDLSDGATRVDNVQPDDLFNWRKVKRSDAASNQDYMNNKGWKQYHQRVYKIENGKKIMVAEQSVFCNVGWKKDWQNNIRVEAIDNTVNLYFQTGTITEKDWTKVFTIETEWNKGAIGIFNFSQPVEFLNISTMRLEPLQGTIQNLSYTGHPKYVIDNSTKNFCDPYVKELMVKNGYESYQDYWVGYYQAVLKSPDGIVSIALNGQGPLAVYSELDLSVKTVDDLDIVAWTHYEELEAIPIFAMKIEDKRKIEIEKPKVEIKNMEIDNWYMRIKQGKFQKRIKLPYYEPSEKIPQIYVAYPSLVPYAPKSPEEEKEIILHYEIPEYTYQEFLDKPIVLIDRESPIILNEYAIQTRYPNLVLQSRSGISYLEVEAIRQNNARTLRISDVDAAKGIIYLHDRIREQDEILVRYAYYENWYTYRGFHKKKVRKVLESNYSNQVMVNTPADFTAMNVVTLKEVEDTPEELDFFHLDLNPSPGHQYTLAKDDFFRWIPLDIEETYDDVVDEESKQLLVKPIHIYLRPYMILDENQNIINQTQRSTVIYHTDQEHWFDPNDYYYDPTMFRLGKIIVQANSQIDKDEIILDTRTRGGGLDEALSREIIAQVNKESLYHWDIGYFDGEAYQENGIFILRLPNTLLDRFHETEIQAAVAKHKAYGLLPIIEYYDPNSLKRSRYNLLPNPEFYDGKDLSYHNPGLDSGEYEIQKLNVGTGDNYVLILHDHATYGISIPGDYFKDHKTHQVEIKAMKTDQAMNRKAGIIEVYYEDGNVEKIDIPEINQTNWMIYKQKFDTSRVIHQVNILINDSDSNIRGDIMIDYLMIFPITEFDEENTEIVEI